MASIAHQSRMGEDRSHVLHPFFKGVKTKAADGQLGNYSGQVTEKPAIPENSALTSKGDSGATGKTKRFQHVELGGTNNVEELMLVTTKSTAEAGIMRYDMAENGSWPSTSLLSGPDEHLRKRRRTMSPREPLQTDSPEHNRTWIEQLQAAAIVSHVRSEGISKISAIANPSLTTVDNDSPASCSIPVENELKSIKESPVKKMLKLRNDGKLISPRPKKVTENDMQRVKTKTLGKISSSVQKIVVMRYGLDADSRTLIGHKIEAILRGKERNIAKQLSSQIDCSTVLPPIAPEPFLGPPIPPQVTHPFFLAKSLRPLKLDANGDKGGVRLEPSPTKTPLSQNTTSSPRKQSRVGSITALKRPAPLSDTSLPSQDTKSKPPKFDEGREALWPPHGMIHCRGSPESVSHIDKAEHNFKPLFRQIKSKEVELKLPREEEVLFSQRPYSLKRHIGLDQSDITPGTRRDLQNPKRRVMTGPELQEAIRPRVLSKLPHELSLPLRLGAKPGCNTIKLPPNSSPRASTSHNALIRVFQSIATSTTAFDTFQCEKQDWVHKYAPMCAAEILQPGREMILLRDWLRSLTVSAVSATSTRQSSRSNVKRKKKRKRAEGLEDFIASSDTDTTDLAEVVDPSEARTGDCPLGTKKSVVRLGDPSNRSTGTPRSQNSVVISGPRGCGKTAAVYAVAKELNFQVFEIGPGTRRSGKDLMDKLMELTRNHLVRGSHNNDDVEDAGEQDMSSVLDDVDSGRQSTMQSFLKPDADFKSSSKAKSSTQNIGPRKQKPNSVRQPAPEKENKQGQSLILLEEVDILFEEDKQFWNTVFILALKSKRPIIMTCNDESLVPLDELGLYAIFRLLPPTEQLAIDYLLLMACNEGHLLSRDAVCTLFASHDGDLRAAITQLNFWCQMAVRDSKGGLEWMLIPSNVEESFDEKGERLRVVSEDTYVDGMGLLNSDECSGGCEKFEIKKLYDSLCNWDSEVQDCFNLIDLSKISSSMSRMSSEQSLQVLRMFELSSDALSAADVLPGLGFREHNTACMDNSLSDVTEKDRANHIEGYSLLSADNLCDQSDLSRSIPMALQICSRRVLLTDSAVQSAVSADQKLARRQASNNMQNLLADQRVTRGILSRAFEPLTESPKGSVRAKGPLRMSFDIPIFSIVQDTAPYVRSIVAYDTRLEARRIQLSNLLSQGGRSGKRQRTTRASRAALEGGHKAHTRRERWFPKNTNFSLVLQTGGETWQEVALSRAGGQSESNYDESRRSSITSTGSEA